MKEVSKIIIPTNTFIIEPSSVRKSFFLESPIAIARKVGRVIQREEIKKFYQRELFIDLLEYQAIDPVKQIKKIGGNYQILAGFVFESFIERRINSNLKIKDNILQWILRDSPKELKEIDDINKVLAVVIGSGHAKIKYPDLYSPANPNIDIIFVDTKKKWYPPIHNVYKRYAGIQVKAIKTNYMSSIMHKIIGRPGILTKNTSETHKPYPIYTDVLTLLKDNDGIHSYDKCIDILYKDYKDIFNRNELEEIERRIIKPEHVGLDQEEIEHYYSLVRDWFKNPTSYKFNNMDDHLIDSFQILNIGYKQNESHLKKHLIVTT